MKEGVLPLMCTNVTRNCKDCKIINPIGKNRGQSESVRWVCVKF